MSRPPTLTYAEAEHARYLYFSTTCSIQQVADHFGVCSKTINKIIDRKPPYDGTLPLRLTKEEAYCLSSAAGQIMEDPSLVIQEFPDNPDTALTAYNKLNTLLQAFTR